MNVTLVSPVEVLHCVAFVAPPAGWNSAIVPRWLPTKRPPVTVPAKLATGPTETSVPDSVELDPLFHEIVPFRVSWLAAQLPDPEAVAFTLPDVMANTLPWHPDRLPEMLTEPAFSLVVSPGEIVAEPLIWQTSAPVAACPNPVHTKAPSKIAAPVTNIKRCFNSPPVFDCGPCNDKHGGEARRGGCGIPRSPPTQTGFHTFFIRSVRRLLRVERHA